MIAMQHPASPAKDAGSFNYDESRNPRRLPDVRIPSPMPHPPPVFPAKAGIHVPSRCLYENRRPASCHRTATTPVFPAKARTHIASPMAQLRLSGKSRNPRPLPVSPGPPVAIDTATPHPSFRQKPEPTSPPGVSRPASCHRHRHSPPVFPAKAGIHVPSPASVCPPVAMGRGDILRHRHPPPVFPAKAGTHVPSPVSVYPRTAIDGPCGCPGWTIEHPCKRRRAN